MARVVQWGFGAMGSGMVERMLQCGDIQIVGVIDRRPEYQGRDIGDILGLGCETGITVSNDATKVLREQKPDLTLLATGSFIDEVTPVLTTIMESGSNAITIAEELAYPWRLYPEKSKRLDEIAKKNGVTLLGTGVNPGFVLDTLILLLTGCCSRIDKITATRINDLSPFGPTVMQSQGVGLKVDEFNEGLERGTIVGHIGFQESIAMIADALGWKLDEIVEKREPIVAIRPREGKFIKVKPGMVAGCRHLGYGMMNGKAVIELVHPQQIQPSVEDIDTGDYIKIEGTTYINVSNNPEVPGGEGTMNVAVNMIPQVISAKPGFTSMKDLPMPISILANNGQNEGSAQNR